MQVLCASEGMALVPSRLLLPVRAVEPAHPSALSSSSVCSASVAYPHFSLFFFHTSTHRSTSPVSARVSEAPFYRHNRNSQFHRQPKEAGPFDDLQSLYEEERGRLSYRNRNPNGETHPAQRYGRESGNSGRPAWEPSNYAPRRSRRVSEGEARPRYGKPWSSQGRNSSSWSSQTEDGPSEMHRDRPQQTMEDERGRKFDMGNRSMERTSFARRGSVYNERGNPPWARQGSFSSRGAYEESGNSPWEKQGSFSRRGSGGAYKESGNSPREKHGNFSRRGSGGENGNSPWEKKESFSQRGSFPWQDSERVGQSTPRQDEGRASSWEGAYTEKSSGTDGRSQRHYNGNIAREQLSSHWSSDSRKSSSWQSSNWSGDVEEQAPLHEIGLRKSAKNSWPSAPHDYPLAPWQSKQWETEGRGGAQAAAAEEGYGYREAKEELKGEQDPNSSSVSPIARIMERLRTVGDTASAQGTGEDGRHSRGGLADYLTLPSAKEYLSDRSMPLPSTEESPEGELDTRFPWEIEEEATREDDRTVEMARRLRPLSAAELTISAPELKRLRILSVHLKQRVKLGKQGVTTDLVNSIMQRFRTCEVVKVKCEGPPAGNMKKTLEILEKKTGGLIIWKAGSVAVLYRGKDFGQPVSEIVDVLLAKKLEKLMSTDGQEVSSSGGLRVEDGALREGDTDKSDNGGLIPDDNSKQANSGVSLDDATQQDASLRKKRLGPEFEKMEEYVMEVEDILTDLGPRYEEWTGSEPIPVDGDLLPAVIPDYSPPYRLLPFGIRPNLSNTVATHLRRLCRPLAPHFVIGRDRGLQGLACAMVKLWEKSEIAKIGIKRGILNTNQERIAEDLKLLTGGFFLCRDKKSMTFYRGKDFLPQAVSAALAERQAMAQTLQDEEETGRMDRSLKVKQSIVRNSDVTPSWVHFLDPEEQIRLKKEAAKARRLQIVSHIERKLKMALAKKAKAGRELEKVEELMRPVGSPDDKETVTDEERFMLRKLGLKMKAYLLVGRRGVFSGVVQNMHLHWKHRELVKIVVKEKDPVHLKEMASMLECESGGILISVDPTSKGYAIVYYRGKNYTRPPQLRPPNLLTKRLALKRSLEIQRRLSLSKHIQTLEEEIVHLRAGLSKLSTDSLESSEHQVQNEEDADAHSSLEHDGASDNQPMHIQSSVLHNGLLEKQGTVATFAEEGFNLSEDEEEMVISKISKRKLRRLCEMGPIFRAVRLSKTERHAFRNEVLNLSKAAQYMVGKSNPLSTVAKAIRLYFLDHAFIKIGVRNRPHGTSVQDVVEELEDLTGGTVYAQDDYKIVLYRGWPTGENMPLDDLYDVLSLEQCDVLEEDGDDDGDDDSVDTEDEDDVVKEGDNGLMVADTSVKNMNYSSVEDEDEREDLEWDWSDGNIEEDDSEEGDDDDDDLRWVGLANGNAEEGDEQLTVDNSSDEEEENHEGLDTEGDDDDDDLRLVGLADGNAEEGDEQLTVFDKEEENHEGVDTEGDDDDDDLRWVGLEDGNAEKEGGEGLTVSNSCDKEEENHEGVDTEGRLRWDSLVLGDVTAGVSFSFDLDEDV